MLLWDSQKAIIIVYYNIDII